MTLAGVTAFGLAVVGSSAQAVSSRAATEQVQAQLVASVNAVHPGEQILLGVHQRIIPHWHTYWANPGDSGLATKIAWTLPEGATAGDIQWPVPSRFQLGPVTNHGYSDEVTLLSAIQVPSSVKPGSTFPARATVNWLVCREVCIPQEVQLELTLPVLKPGEPAGRGSPLIEQAQARLPVASPWPITVEQRGNDLSLRVAAPALASSRLKDVWFFPAKWGQVAHNADQPRRVDGDGLALNLQVGEAPLAVGGQLSGVLVLTEEGPNGPVSRGFAVDAKVGLGVSPRTNSSASPSLSLAPAMVLALLGGLVLNLMPCVFPVLSIKALALLRHSEHTPRQKRLHGLVYTLGVLASFSLLGVILIALKAGGSQVGWGFQFQSPLFVLAVAYLMFAVGLSLSG
ncbi:MAG: thiol:disulfide interchange protein, partial [Rubrivivax sp.]